MKRNQILIRAVSLALLIYSTGAYQQALALGLGEIDIKSQLGQPFRAHIKVYGTNDLTAKQLADPTCFRVNANADNINQITRANLLLSNVVSDEAILTVSTSEIINEPISNLSVISDCGGNFRRDYVLLMDPPISNQTLSNTDLAPSANEAKAAPSKKSKVAKPSNSNLDADIESSATQPKVKKSNNVKKNKSTSKENPNIVLHVPDGGRLSQTLESNNPSSNVNQTTQKGVGASKPRLSISGGSGAIAGMNNPQLRMDSHIDVNFKPDPSALAADIEMQDELTAMSNRFANLEKQMGILQKRNATLEADNKLKTKIIADQAAENNKFNWLAYIFGGAVALAGAYYLFGLWRKRQLLKAENAIAGWAPMEEENLKFDTSEQNDLYAPLVEDTVVSSKNEKSTEASDTLGFETESSQILDTSVKKSTPELPAFNFNAERDSQFVVEEQNTDATVLDHADVFLSHGRTSLAIQLLQNHLLEHPKQSVTIWLFLLDLLSKENMQSLYEQTATECKEHYNIKIAGFSKNEDTSIQSLDAYPRIMEGLQQAWGTPAALVYLDDLIYNNRLELRTGLDKNLIEELLLLKAIAQENFNSAEVIHLDEKKVALKEQKEALLATKKAEKLQKIDEQIAKEEEKKEASEKLFEFGLIEWK